MSTVERRRAPKTGRVSYRETAEPRPERDPTTPSGTDAGFVIVTSLAGLSQM